MFMVSWRKTPPCDCGSERSYGHPCDHFDDAVNTKPTEPLVFHTDHTTTAMPRNVDHYGGIGEQRPHAL